MITQCLDVSDESLSLAAAALRSGQVVALPTETVYGLAADATSDAACAQIFAAKGRPTFNPLVVHIASVTSDLLALDAAGWIRRQDMSSAAQEVAQTLCQHFWPGPLTMIFPRGSALSPMVAGNLSTVALRMPSHPVFQQVLARFGRPLAAPSANRFCRISPTTAQHVLNELAGEIPLVIDGGPCHVGLESSIVKIMPDGSPMLLRAGGIPFEDIQACVGRVCYEATADSAIEGPGMLREHYAPEKPLLLISDLEELRLQLEVLKLQPQSIALLTLEGQSFGFSPVLVSGHPLVISHQPLSASGSAEEVARGLYAALRQADAGSAQVIVVVRPKNSSGLWLAIHDRIRRASARWAAPKK